MFYVRPNHPYYAPRHSYPAAPSYYAQPEPEPEPYVSPDELARARYLQALREQRAARKAYADALAERELQRMEHQYGADDDEPYTRFGAPRARRAAQPRYYEQPAEDDGNNEGYGYDSWADALRAQALEQERARALEQERAREIAAEHERQRLRAAQLAAEQERQRALAAAEEERRQAHAYQQARAYADALAQKQMNSKQPNRKLGRVTPDVRPAPQTQQEPSKPVRIHIRSRSTSPQRPAPAPPAPSADVPPAAPEPKTALSAIATVESALSKLRETFALPPQLEFKAPRELSYASTNAPVRAYEYELGKLLEKLDEVESAGVAEIRKERKRVVELVESALSDLEHKVEEEWRKAHPAEDVPDAKEDAQPGEEMEVDPAREPVSASDAELATTAEGRFEPMEIESSAVVETSAANLPDHADLAAVDFPRPSNSLSAVPALHLDHTVPATVGASASADFDPAPPASFGNAEPVASTPNDPSDASPLSGGLDAGASQPIRISITPGPPASQEAQSAHAEDADRVAISSHVESHVPASDKPASLAQPETPSLSAQRIDEFEMV